MNNPFIQNAEPISLAARCLEIAAQTGVDLSAYSQHQSWLNLAKVRQLGEAYRNGWLHNLMGRITPITARDANDYVLMADLFVLNKEDAQELMQSMSEDLTRFATEAGINPTNPDAAEYRWLNAHLNLYTKIGGVLSHKFGMGVPKPFTSATIQVNGVPNNIFIRDFLRARAA